MRVCICACICVCVFTLWLYIELIGFLIGSQVLFFFFGLTTETVNETEKTYLPPESLREFTGKLHT